MTGYSVKQLAQLAGVSIRTLHHYDQIGLLKPGRRADSGYRYYGKPELLRLQQILFYRELKYPLKQIKEILDNPMFDLQKSLAAQRQQILQEADRLHQLLATIDKTIVGLKNQEYMISDQELYEGFTPEEKDSYRAEVAERWGDDKLHEVEGRLKKLGTQKWTNIKDKGKAIEQLLADLMTQNQAITSKVVQKAIAAHYVHTCEFWTPNKEQYRGLGKMYVEDDRFKAHYEQFGEGLAVFIRRAIDVYCDNGMKVQ